MPSYLQSPRGRGVPDPLPRRLSQEQREDLTDVCLVREGPKLPEGIPILRADVESASHISYRITAVIENRGIQGVSEGSSLNLQETLHGLNNAGRRP